MEDGTSTRFHVSMLYLGQMNHCAKGLRLAGCRSGLSGTVDIWEMEGGIGQFRILPKAN